MENSYWNGKGKLQEEYYRLEEKFVPMTDKAETLIGESLRAAVRIYADAYNNGFGNNTSGAWHFLYTYVRPYIKDSDFTSALEHLEEKVNHENSDFTRKNNMTEIALETMLDKVIQFGLNTESNPWPSPCDMFDLQERDWQIDYQESYGYRH